MTRDELETEIRNKLGYNTGLAQSIITGALDNAQDLLEKEPELPWFLETEISTISTVVDEERIPVPSGYIMSIPENPLWYYNTTAAAGTLPDWIEIPKANMGDLRIWNNRNNESAQVGAPQAYALQGKYFRLFPTPDAVYAIKHIYYAQQAKLTSGSDTNDWSINAPYMLLGKAGTLISMNNRDQKSADIFNTLYQDDARRILLLSEGREHAGAVYARGGAD